MEINIRLNIAPPKISCTIASEDDVVIHLDNSDRGLLKKLVKIIQDFAWVACLDKNRFNGERLYVKTLNEMTYNTYRARRVRNAKKVAKRIQELSSSLNETEAGV